MSAYELTQAAKVALQSAISTASRPFLGGLTPQVEAEIVDGTDGSFLHVTIATPSPTNASLRRHELRRAVIEASLGAKPMLGAPVVTIKAA